MRILPAIDILHGKPVRLVRGEYDSASQVAADVKETAACFEKEGASMVHLVDLDGAKAGKPVNADLIVQTAASLSIPVEVGGGIRTLDDVDMYLQNGVLRVILGTAALKDPDMVAKACTRYPGRIAAGLDCRHEKIALEGWLEDSEVSVFELAALMEKAGVAALVVTDISKDGTLQGPSLDLYRKLRDKTSLELVASGGVSSAKDIADLKELGMDGAITGKALYSGNLSVAQARAAAGEDGC